MLVYFILLLCVVIAPPVVTWVHNLLLCEDKARCNNCPVSQLRNFDRICRETGKRCEDMHYCCTRKWL